MGLVPDHHNKVSCNKESCNPFAGGGSCLQFEKNETLVKHNKAKPNEIRYAHIKSSKIGKVTCKCLKCILRGCNFKKKLKKSKAVILCKSRQWLLLGEGL